MTEIEKKNKIADKISSLIQDLEDLDDKSTYKVRKTKKYLSWLSFDMSRGN